MDNQNMIKKKEYKFLEILFFPFHYALVHAISLLMYTALNGFTPIMQIIVMAKIINTAIAVAENKANISSVYLPIFYMILLIGYQWTSEGLSRFSQTKVSMGIRAAFRTIVTEKIAKLNYKHIENNETWDLIKRVLQNPEDHISGVFLNMLSLASVMINIIGILTLIFRYVWWAPLLILGLSIPLFYLASKSAKENYGAEKFISENVRRYEYLGEILTGRDAAEERTLFGFTDRINSDYMDHYKSAYKVRLKLRRKWFLKMKTGSFVASIVSILIVFIFINPVFTGEITTGFFISIVRGVFGLIKTMSWNFTHYIDQLATHNEYIKDLNVLLGLDETEGATDKPGMSIPVFRSLEFRDVRFRYPKTEKYILDGVSFKIESGRHYAFVGVNGAGKTTIVKLITGLYDEYEGDILINGTDIKSCTLSELKSFVSVLYQDFARYYISLKDNVLVGNINEMKNENTNEKLMETMGHIGLSKMIDDLSQGMDTPLGKIKENGQNLSGGQWQRVAIARSLVNPAPLKILDEPTASLDPVGESKLYEEFENITRNCTTVLISHRLGSTKLADEIFVIEEGKVIENGSHEELMSCKGIYSAMYNSQKDWYEL